MGKYFDTGWLKPITPVTNQIGTSSGDLAFADKDIVFDWLAVDIPKGTHKLINAMMIVQGTHGARQAEVDFQLWFAKSIDGVAPPSLGTPNNAQTGTGHRKHMLGTLNFEATMSTSDINAFESFYNTGMASAGGTLNPSQVVVVGGDPNSGVNVGYDTIYVAGITAGALNFSTNVLLNQGGNQAATTTTTTLTTDGAHATKVFEVGDIIQAMDLAAIGTITALTTTSITVDLCEAALVDDDEILTTSPVKVKLAFEQ
jgi:hypothetical protein|tara:strand:- start:503 stop:1273 length:771 start_codon:yes stop_codon:yes gene_type:complete